MPRRRYWRPAGLSPTLVYALAALALAAVGYAFLQANTPWQPYYLWLAAWSAATFALYGFDKRQAPRHGLRVPELVLHGLALVGGFIGGWAGMFAFRHKIRRTEFWLVLVVSTILHLGLARDWFTV